MKTLDLIECAEFLMIERTKALTLAGTGVLPGAKIGRSWVLLEEDLVEYLRTEARKQMRDRQVEAVTDDELAASAVRNTPLIMSPRAAARKASQKSRIDLSSYNDDGTPKRLAEI